MIYMSMRTECKNCGYFSDILVEVNDERKAAKCVRECCSMCKSKSVANTWGRYYPKEQSKSRPTGGTYLIIKE